MKITTKILAVPTKKSIKSQQYFIRVVVLSILTVFMQTHFFAQKKTYHDVNKSLVKKFCDSYKCNAKGVIDFSTGINASSSELPPGNVDPHWKLINMPPLQSGSYHSSMEIPKIYVIEPFQNNWNNVPHAGIVSPANTPRYPSNNLFGGQPWRARKTFCLCETTRVTFKGSFTADDEGFLVLKRSDGQEIFRLATTNAFLSPTPFSETHILNAGSYYLEFELRNTGGHATGFSINGIMNTKGNYLVDGYSKCCPSSVITVQKILENKETCNGKLDKGEKPGENWIFNLTNSKGQVIQSGTTDASGELTFNNLRPGSYTLSEVAQSGWTSKSPANGKISFRLEENRVLNYTFFNCPSESASTSDFDPCCPPTSDSDLSQQFEFKFSGGMNAPYAIELKPTLEFRTRMQMYANYLHALCPAVTKLQLHFALHNQLNYVDNGMNIYAHFIPGNPNNQMFGGTTFSNNSSLDVNHWYRIHLGTYTIKECGLIDKNCDVPNVDWNIQVQGNRRMGQFKTKGKTKSFQIAGSRARLKS